MGTGHFLFFFFFTSFFNPLPIFLQAGGRREEKEGLEWWGEGWRRGCKDKTESCSRRGAPKRERQKENKQFMSRAHAACVCVPRAAGPPCSQGGFCSPAMMDGRTGPFRPAMFSSGIYITLAFHRSPLTLAWGPLPPQPARAPLVPPGLSPWASQRWGLGVSTAAQMLWVLTQSSECSWHL